MNKNKELPASDLLTSRELTIYDYVFDIKDVRENLLICKFDRVPYSIGQKLRTALLINVFEKDSKKVVDKGLIKNKDDNTDTVEIQTQKGVVKRNSIKSYFVKVVPAYVVKQQIPKWVGTEAFIELNDNTAVLNYIIDFNYVEGYMKWELMYIDGEDKRLTVAVGNDNLTKGVAYIEKENTLFKKGRYELEIVKYLADDISNGKIIVKWDLELNTSALTKSNSIQTITS
jgi:hypothetical protein